MSRQRQPRRTWDPFVRRTVGWMYIGAPLLPALGLLFRRAPEARPLAMMAVVLACWALGAWLLVHGVGLSGRPTLHQVALAGSALISAGLYCAGDPAYGSRLLYTAPVMAAATLLGPWQVVTQVAFASVAYAGSTTLLVAVNPDLGPLDRWYGAWFILSGCLLGVALMNRAFVHSLRMQDLRLRRGFEDSPIPIGLVTTDMRWLEVNDALCEMLGRKHHELIGHSTSEVTHPDDVAISNAALEGMALHRERRGFEKRYLHTDGSVIWARVRTRRLEGPDGASFYFSVLHDATREREIEEMLRHDATHDTLTGLPNRAAVLTELETALADPSPRGSVAVFLTDLDQFKVINDSLGHFAGDDVIHALGERIGELFSSRGMVARLGGDEFVMVVRDTDESEAGAIAEELVESIRRPIEVEGITHHIGASVGVVLATPRSRPVDLLRDADTAMYRAKAAGRGRVEIFGEACRIDALARHQLEQDLRAALANGSREIRVHFQPMFRFSDGSLSGFEALARFRDGDDAVSPARFIPVAEDTGLIVPLGRRVLHDAAEQFARWREEFPELASTRLFVNVSGRQLDTSGFIETVEEVLRATGLPPAALMLEMTESVMLDQRRAAPRLRMLRSLGVGLGLDDFGTGYSSLSQVRRLPLDVLKIDRSFVAGLGMSARDRAIVASTIGLAHAVGVEVVAEGVETDQQHTALAAAGCDHAQGYLLARPMDPERVRELLASRSLDVA
jgi:diguanylate cyclase (GGDEF)-like protein/PAS domain S-box-containing protein